MKIAISDLKQKLITAAKKHVSASEAEYFADLTIDTHLKKSPRSNPLKSAIGDLKTWENTNKEVIRKVDKPAVTVYDFQGKAPALKVKQIHDELVKKAKKNGIAVAGVVNSAGFHTLTFWTDALQERDMIGICFVNGGPAGVVPFGAKGGRDQAVFGTNPLSYAIPASKTVISADMATSEVPYFEILQAKKDNTQLSDRAVVDASGKPTSQINDSYLEGEIANISPLGANHKGSALVLLVEILTSSLLGSPNSREMNLDSFIPEEHGNLIVAFDISSFTNFSDFKNSTQNLADIISNLEPVEGREAVQYPGQGARQRKEKYLEEGVIEVDEELLELLG